MRANDCFRVSFFATVILLSAMLASAQDQNQAPQVSYLDASHSTVLLNVNGKQYIVDVTAQSVREKGASSAVAQSSSGQPPDGQSSAAAALFREHCAGCHGADGKGNRAKGTPDFTSQSVQSGFSDSQIAETIRKGKAGRMPAWSDKLSDAQIASLAAYIRTFSEGSARKSRYQTPDEAYRSGVYQPGDDVLVSLPTGRPLDRHGFYANFSHRFASDPAFTGPGKGGELFGLDSVSISSFGIRYGVTDNLSVAVWRSPSFVGRPIQIMAAYNLLDEHREQPLNMAVRVSIEGQNNFEKSFTENIETIFSRTLFPHAQIYVVPTMSFNARRLVQDGLRSRQILDFPGTDTVSVGVGASVDIRPTVALVAEIIPTVHNGVLLGIHRPAYSFGIQKKIWRHAFTLALSNSPGTTVSQRAATRATYGRPGGPDTPAGLFLGFDIMRQIH
jgi:mono/diheme cytochrome c family protein